MTTKDSFCEKKLQFEIKYIISNAINISATSSKQLAINTDSLHLRISSF